MNNNLTVGKPEGVLWKFCLPLFASVIFQQLYNIADSFVAGKFMGEQALAAVGNGYEISLIFIAVAFGCNIGCSVVVSNLFGAGKYKQLKTAVYTTFTASGLICLMLMVSGLVFCKPLLLLINTPAEILSDSQVYLKIYILSLPFVFFYNVSTGIFSALGDSETPFYFLMLSSLSNIGMDILFVTVFKAHFKYGVDGVAWATFLCQGVSCILAVIFVLKRLKAIKTEKAPVFSRKLFSAVLKIALPSMMQQSFISIGNIVIQGIINSFGTGVIAGYCASVKLNNLVITSFTTFGNGVSNYTAQNIGAEKYDRVKSGFKAGIKAVWILCVPIVLLYFFKGSSLVCLFLDNPGKDAQSAGTMFIKVLSPFYFVISAKLISDGILRGAGRMNRFMLATFTDLILRVVLARVLSVTELGYVGIWLAWPVGWFVAAVISIVFCRKINYTKTAALP